MVPQTGQIRRGEAGSALRSVPATALGTSSSPCTGQTVNPGSKPCPQIGHTRSGPRGEPTGAEALGTSVAPSVAQNPCAAGYSCWQVGHTHRGPGKAASALPSECMAEV